MTRATEWFQRWDGEEGWKNIWDGKITMLEDCAACVCMRRENVERGCGGVRGQVCDGRIKKSKGGRVRGIRPKG